MMLAEINPLGQLADGSFVALDAHMDMENEARPRHDSCWPSSAWARRRPARRARRRRSRSPASRSTPGPPRGGRQRDRVRRQPRPGDRRRRRLADAVRRRPGPRRTAPPTTARSAATPRSPRPAGWRSSCCQKPGVDKIAVMMSIVSNTRVDIVARGVIKACLELGYRPGREDRHLPHPRRLGGGGLQDPRASTGSSTPTARCRSTRPPRPARSRGRHRGHLTPERATA